MKKPALAIAKLKMVNYDSSMNGTRHMYSIQHKRNELNRKTSKNEKLQL